MSNTFSREFAAPAESVFAAHTRSALTARWIGPQIDQFAARAGGRWRYTTPDGRSFHGVFHEVTPNQRIVRTVESDGRVSLETRTFTDLGNGRSRVDGRSDFDLPDIEAAHQRLDALLAAGFDEDATPSIRYSGTTVDCADPGALADFYAALTGGVVVMRQPHWALIRADDGEIAFQGTPGYQPPVWPDPAASIQMHLDFYVTDRAGTEKRALELGATKYDFQPNDDHCTVLADPAGHAFCLSTWGEPS
ncbi:VOC family protein [Actinoplanes sp. NPDC026619]|uniref:VOC family protein n=1 Tax=Actinoplanes sp. NPDC026619 TaxID=3155798 RepID=UPI0033FC8D19